MNPLATQIAALPIIQQIEIMREVAAGKAWGDITYTITQTLDKALDMAHRDAIDQAAAENDALHGKEVSVLEPYISRSGLTVGY